MADNPPRSPRGSSSIDPALQVHPGSRAVRFGTSYSSTGSVTIRAVKSPGQFCHSSHEKRSSPPFPHLSNRASNLSPSGPNNTMEPYHQPCHLTNRSHSY
eukprot:scaffold125931_cov17-Tisochrysis_lutea.AAC.1